MKLLNSYQAQLINYDTGTKRDSTKGPLCERDVFYENFKDLIEQCKELL